MAVKYSSHRPQLRPRCKTCFKPPGSLFKMKRRPFVVKTFCTGLLFAFSFLAVLVAGQVSHSTTSFQHLPARFLFFDDTDVSDCRGMSVEVILIAKASIFIEHPVDNRYVSDVVAADVNQLT